MSSNCVRERELQMNIGSKVTAQCKSSFHSNNLMNKIVNFFEEKKFCDVTLISEMDDIKIDAHKMILSAASEYFLGMFSGAMKESQEKEVKLYVDGNSLKSVIDYIYTSTIELTTDSVEDILKAASLFEITSLKILCCQFIAKQLDTSNCLGIALFAEQYNLEKLYKTSESYVCENFAVVCKDEEFFKLDVFQLSKFLSSSELKVDSEEDVFKSLMTWINHDKPKREEYIGKLLHHVRFALLTPNFIASDIETTCKSIESIDCERLICKAYKWHLLPEFRLSLFTEKQMNLRNFKDMLMAISGWNNSENKLNVGLYYSTLSNWVNRSWPSLGIGRKNFASTSFKGKLIIAGGLLTSTDETTDRVDCFDPINLKWTALAPLKTKRHSFKMATLNGCIYAVGGKNGLNIVTSVEKWDSCTNTWTEVAPMIPTIEDIFFVTASSTALCVSAYKRRSIHMHTPEWRHYLYDPLTDLWKTNWLTASASTDYLLGIGNVSVFGNEFFLAVSRKTITRYNHVIKSTDVIVNNLKEQCTQCVSVGGRIIAYGTNNFHEYVPFKNEWNTMPRFENSGQDFVLISNS